MREKQKILGLHVLYNYDRKAKTKMGLKIFAFEEIHNRKEAMIFTSLHNNFLPEVANMVIDAKYPGFVDKHFSCPLSVNVFYEMLIMPPFMVSD